MDFMSTKEIKPNTREYAHHLRSNYDKFTRIDFTQTILFLSAKQLTKQSDNTFTLRTSFSLNDQISQFQISVNLFSSKGKQRFLKKQLTSSMGAYTKFTLPESLIRGDVFNIPITVVNNHSTTKKVSIVADEYVFGNGKEIIDSMM